MDIIKINQNAIKVILSCHECEGYEFISDTDSEDEIMLSSLNALLLQVKDTIGTDLIGKRLLVQVYCAHDGSCEVYIAGTEGDGVYKERVAPHNVKRATGYKCVYRFDSLDSVLTVCQRLSGITNEESSQIYYDDCKEKYYLVCESISSKEMRFSFLCEYGKQLKTPMYHYIKEHLRCLCDSNAIKIFSCFV